MKWLSLLVVLSAFSVQAQVDSCSEAIDDAKTMCDGARRMCANVRECLVRRDTCVDGIPKTESACIELNNCMQEYKSEFDGLSRCDYSWYRSASGSTSCFPKKHFLFIEDGCPGRVHGLLNAAAWGLDATVDSDYDCAAVVKQRSQKVKSCDQQLDRVAAKCGSLPANLAHLKQYQCSEAQNFASFTPGQWSIATHSNSERVIDTNRSQVPRRPSGGQTPPPTNSTSR